MGNCRFGYNEDTGEYGYIKEVEGADTLFPFKSGNIPDDYLVMLNGADGILVGGWANITRTVTFSREFKLKPTVKIIVGTGNYTNMYISSITTTEFKYNYTHPSGNSESTITAYWIATSPDGFVDTI